MKDLLEKLDNYVIRKSMNPHLLISRYDPTTGTKLEILSDGGLNIKFKILYILFKHKFCQHINSYWLNNLSLSQTNL